MSTGGRQTWPLQNQAAGCSGSYRSACGKTHCLTSFNENKLIQPPGIWRSIRYRNKFIRSIGGCNQQRQWLSGKTAGIQNADLTILLGKCTTEGLFNKLFIFLIKRAVACCEEKDVSKPR